MCARSAWRLRARPGAESFAAAWDSALEIGHHEALGSAIARAVEGVERPIRYRGRVVWPDTVSRTSRAAWRASPLPAPALHSGQPRKMGD
jgi:hypothetical protein